MRLEHASHSVDQQNFDKLKAAYDACMDENTIKNAGVAPLMDILHQIKDIFPAQPSKRDDEQIADAILYLSKLEVTALASLSTSADDKDPDTVIVALSAPWTIGLPAKERYNDEEIVNKYKATLGKVMSALFPGVYDTATLSDIVEFEKKLAAASPDAEDRQDVTVCRYQWLKNNWFY